MGLEKVIIYTDTHEYAPHSMNLLSQLEQEADLTNVISLGDNIDRIEALRSEVPEATKRYCDLRIRMLTRYISGNHEAEFYNLHEVFHFGGTRVLFTHGDRVFWKKSESNAFRNLPLGMGKFTRIFKRVYHFLRDIVSRYVGLSDKELIRCLKLARLHEARIVVTGHKHPKEMLVEEIEDVIVICLPRGRHELFLGSDLLQEADSEKFKL